MPTHEKYFSIFAILCLACLMAGIFLFPQARSLPVLIPVVSISFILNAGLLFVTFKDIMTRPFTREGEKYIWLTIVFLFFPAIIIYLPKHGFKPKGKVR